MPEPQAPSVKPPAPALSHIDKHGRARMVDVGAKEPVRREAVAEAFFCAAPGTLDRVIAGDLPKGEALAVARVAAITAAKRCDELVPLCHTLPLDVVNVDFEMVEPGRLRITAAAATTSKTGVEMEALAAVSIAALTLYDMTKAIDRKMHVDGIRVVRKEKIESRAAHSHKP